MKFKMIIMLPLVFVSFFIFTGCGSDKVTELPQTTFTINFNTGLDDSDVESMVVVGDQTVELPTLEAYGQVFKGWYYNGDDGFSTMFYESTITLDSERFPEVIELYAHWETVRTNLIVDFGFDYENKEAYAFYNNTYMPYFQIPTNAKYDFQGIYSEPDGKGTMYYDKDNKSDYVWDRPEEEVTIYAYWTKKKIDLIFIIGSYYEYFVIEDVLVDEPFVLPESMFEKTGYVLSGWREYEGTSYSVGSNYIVPATNYKEHNLYAVWSPITYNLNLVANDGTSSERNETLTYDESFKLPNNAFSKKGYSIIGWSTTKNGEIKYPANESILNLASVQDASTKLYAVWKANDISLTTNLDGGTANYSTITATYDALLPTVLAPQKTGYVFQGYFEKPNGLGTEYYDENMKTTYIWNETETRILYAYWELKLNNLIFSSNSVNNETYEVSDVVGGSEVITIGAIFENAGYDFVAWNTSPNGDGQTYTVNQTFLMPMSNEDVVIYAIWKAKQYTISFNSNGGVGEENSVVVTYNTLPAKLVNIPTLFGYDFQGYYSLQNDIEVYYYNANLEPIKNWNIAKDTVLLAGWKATDYEITYHLNGGVNSEFNPSVYNLYVGVEEFYASTKAGYKFAGWYDNSELTGDAVTTLSTSQYGNISLYAKYTPITYHIEFIANGGVGEMAIANFEYDTEYYLPSNKFSKFAYHFKGWALIPNGSVVYNNLATIKNLAKFEGETITLYAIWNLNDVRIVLTVGTAGTGGTTFTKKYGEAIGSLQPPTSTHYQFDGWYTSLNDNITSTTLINDENLTFTQVSSTLMEAKITARFIPLAEWSTYIKIYNKNDIESIRRYPNANYVIMNDINFGGDTITSLPIFSGKIYGAGFKIYNYNIRSVTPTTFDGVTTNRVGFFTGLTSTASIKYLGFAGNITITANEYNKGDDIWIGGIAAVSNGHIFGSYNSGTISLTTDVGITTSRRIVGGLVGELYLGTVENSFNAGAVTVNVTGTSAHICRAIAGGVVGLTSQGDILSSYNTGTITGNGASTRSDVVYAGGILGLGSSTQDTIVINIHNSYNKGSIYVNSTTSAGALVAGGIAGELNGKASNISVKNSFTTGIVKKTGGDSYDKYVYVFEGGTSGTYSSVNNYYYNDPNGNAIANSTSTSIKDTEFGNLYSRLNSGQSSVYWLNTGGNNLPKLYWENLNYFQTR